MAMRTWYNLVRTCLYQSIFNLDGKKAEDWAKIRNETDTWKFLWNQRAFVKNLKMIKALIYTFDQTTKVLDFWLDQQLAALEAI